MLFHGVNRFTQIIQRKSAKSDFIRVPFILRVEMISTIPEVKRKFDVDEVRKDFPILKRFVNGKQLVYLDNAATSQKPQSVIDSLTQYYSFDNANIHRGLYFLSELATEQFETARLKVKELINALSASEIIFVRGTTEAINLVASSLCRAKHFKDGDEVIISTMEHHANIVPWQLISDRKKINLKVIPISNSGELDLDAYEKMITEKTKNIILYVDGLPPITKDKLEAVLKELADLIKMFCGGRINSYVLSKDKNTIEINSE